MSEHADEVVKAALAFVASTSVFRQPKECREQFERLAVAVLTLPTACSCTPTSTCGEGDRE